MAASYFCVCVLNCCSNFSNTFSFFYTAIRAPIGCVAQLSLDQRIFRLVANNTDTRPSVASAEAHTHKQI